MTDSFSVVKGTRCLFQLFPDWNVSYIYFCLTHRLPICFRFFEKCDDVEGRKKNEPTWAGNNCFSETATRLYQDPTEDLWKYSGCYTRNNIGKALGHKIWLLCMKGLEQWCLSRGLVLYWCCRVLGNLSLTGVVFFSWPFRSAASIW